MTIASIDIGTNTILMLIAVINNKNIIPVKNEYRMPRIGKGLVEGTPINNDSKKALFEVLNEYYNIIKEHNCSQILIKATNAFRIASNRDELISEIKNTFGFNVEVVSGKREAMLSYLGAVSAVSKDNNIVIDIGGGSTEIIFGKQNKIVYSKSFNSGVVSLTERFLRNDPPALEQITLMEESIVNTFKEIKNLFPPDAIIIAVAGTPTTLSCIKQGLFDYDEDLVEGSILTQNELLKFSKELAQMHSADVLRKYKNVVLGREDILLAGTLILYHIIRLLGANETTVSSRGIRYGTVIEYLSEKTNTE